MILDVIVEDKKKRLPEHKKNISEIKMRELAEKLSLIHISEPTRP